MGIRSALALPLSVRGAMLGVLVFESLRAERPWADELVQRLQLLGEVLPACSSESDWSSCWPSGYASRPFSRSTRPRSAACPRPRSTTRSSGPFAGSPISSRRLGQPGRVLRHTRGADHALVGDRGSGPEPSTVSIGDPLDGGPAASAARWSASRGSKTCRRGRRSTGRRIGLGIKSQVEVPLMVGDRWWGPSRSARSAPSARGRTSWCSDCGSRRGVRQSPIPQAVGAGRATAPA